MLILCRQLNCWSQRGPRGSDQFLDNADRSMSGLNQWTVIQTAQSCGCRVLLVEKEEGGCIKSLFYKAHIWGIVPCSHSSGGGMIAMWDAHRKKNSLLRFWRKPVSGQHNINFDSQTRLTHKIPYLLVHLLPMLLLAPVIHRHNCICIHL